MAGADGIRMHREDDRYRRCRRFGAPHVYGAPRDDDVDPEPDQLAREFWDPSGIPLGPAGLDQHVLTLDPAAVAQLLPEAIPQTSFRGVRGLLPQKTDAIQLSQRLRRSEKRRRDECEEENG